ncbi:DUF4142 domain-containing protein [Streptomyces flavofungini]|uniref:DUF4142 domain-containing protein n=1 Tax=Streptomyces flavofungini TaxID=68200 RepID=UPI0034DDE7FB
MRRQLIPAALLTAALSVLAVPQAGAESAVGSQDRMFLTHIHQGNLAEIAAGHDARRHATTACVRDAGAVLVRDHSKLDAAGKKLAAKLHVRLPSAPSAKQRQQLESVQRKAGSPAYDRAWLTAQDAAHRETLTLLDKEIRHGRNGEVVAAARTARPVVKSHLDMVRGGTCHAAG